MKKFLAILMAAAMLFSLSVSVFASDDASSEAEAEESGPKAMIVIGDSGEDTDAEQTEGYELTFYEGGALTDGALSGFLYTTDSSDAALYYSEVSEDNGGIFFTIGGSEVNIAADEYDVSPDALQWLSDVGVSGFNSAAILGDDAVADSCEPVISAKGYTYLNLTGLLVLDEGAARSAFYSDVTGGTTVAGPGAVGGQQGSETPIVVVTNSLLETLGGSAVDGEISVGNTGSRARGIQPQGKSITYLYDSAIVSHTWGAWSTDSARQALDLVAYRSFGQSQGGYGAYADTSCRLFLYGSTVMGSSDGIVASNDGEIYAVASDSTENSTELRAIMAKESNARDLSWQDYLPGEEESVLESCIMGGQTAVQFHMPDQGHSGAGNTRKATLYMNGGSLITDESLIADGVENLAAYNANYAGACIVTKSTQANVLLVGTEMESWSGVLIQCTINSDSNVNDIADGDTAPGSDITMQDMDVSGDIVHDDYQRALRLTLDGTTLTGAIYSKTCEDWNALCEEEFDGEYILNEDGYETIWGVELTLTNGAVWNVTETSVITGLSVEDGCTVNGIITDNGDGTFTVAPLSSGEASV